MEITLNGAPRSCPPGTTVGDLLRELGLRPEVVAVEINRQLVPRRERDGRVLAAGDRVELVTLVGGG
jgi:sulfur carrier protein